MEEGGGEEEINYDENDYNNYDDYNNEVDIDIENENNIINNTKDNIANLEDYEIDKKCLQYISYQEAFAQIFLMPAVCSFWT